MVEVAQFGGRDVMESGGNVSVGDLGLDTGRDRPAWWHQWLELTGHLRDRIGHTDHHLAVQVVSDRTGRGRRGIPRRGNDHHLGVCGSSVVCRPDAQRPLGPPVEDLVADLHSPVFGARSHHHVMSSVGQACGQGAPSWAGRAK